jgi:hypothetical protein
MTEHGDRVRILNDSNGPGWLRVGALATVDYHLSDLGKIICKLDEPSGLHTSVCLYESQEGEHWERVNDRARASQGR